MWYIQIIVGRMTSLPRSDLSATQIHGVGKIAEVGIRHGDVEVFTPHAFFKVVSHTTFGKVR